MALLSPFARGMVCRIAEECRVFVENCRQDFVFRYRYTYTLYRDEFIIHFYLIHDAMTCVNLPIRSR